MTRSVTVFELWRPEGTAVAFTKRIKAKGQFHQWGVDMMEMESNAGNFSIAIVELPDGTVIVPPAELVQFTDETQEDHLKWYYSAKSVREPLGVTQAGSAADYKIGKHV